MEITSKILKASVTRIYRNRFFRKILADESFLTSLCNFTKYETVVLQSYRQSYIKYALTQNIFVKT